MPEVMLRDELSENTLLTGRRAINSRYGSAVNITTPSVDTVRLGRGPKSS